MMQIILKRGLDNINEQRLSYIMTGNTHTYKKIPLGPRNRLYILRTVHDCYSTITCYTLHTLLAHL